MEKNKTILEKLFTIRSDEYERKYSKQHYKELKKYGIEEKEDQLGKFIGSLKELSETEQKTYINYLNELENCMLSEIGYWMEKYYKLGFQDSMSLKDKMSKNEDGYENMELETEFEQNFFDMYSDDFLDFFERHKSKKILNTSYYIRLKDEITRIKKENPKVTAFLEDNEITELSKEDGQAIFDILKIMEEMDTLDLKEAFKLGGKEAYIYFEGMDMLKIKKLN